MANSNPTQARTAKKKKRLKAGTIEEARLMLWRALQRVEQRIEEQEEPVSLNDSLRVLHALSQAVGAYVKVVDMGELEARIQSLELHKQELEG